MTCRIRALTVARPDQPFRLTTTCGWTGLVRQGVTWTQGNPDRDQWAQHTCRKDNTT